MIKLVRLRTNTTVPASLRGDKRRVKESGLLSLWRDRLLGGSIGSPAWKQAYWKAGKKQLKKDTFEKCAYCESPTAVVAHGDVEHFRPKSVYWWLVYCFDNHMYSCQICNQSPYKLDKFPLKPGANPTEGPEVKSTTTDAQLALLVDTLAPDPVDINNGLTLADFFTACRAEHAGFPDPYNEDPEDYFAWEADVANEEIWIRPRTSSARNKFVHETCETHLGLNREELRRWRWTLAYEQLANLKGILDQLILDGVSSPAMQLTQDAIRQMMAANHPYAAMVRYFVNGKWAMGL